MSTFILIFFFTIGFSEYFGLKSIQGIVFLNHILIGRQLLKNTDELFHTVTEGLTQEH